MASGRPDWFGTIVAAGKYDTTFIPIGLDETGAILALMKGAYDSALKTISVDDAGVMKANLSAQDLDFLTVRPAYGQVVEDDGDTAVPHQILTVLKTITGRGAVVFGWITIEFHASRKLVQVHIFVDGDDVTTQSYEQLKIGNVVTPGLNGSFIFHYNDTDFIYAMGINPGMTFESSLVIKAYHSYGIDVSVHWDVSWALVP